MFRKLFGETEQEQIQFLHVRTIITMVLLALLVIALILKVVGFSEGAEFVGNIAGMGGTIILLFVWGWPVIKGLFGITTVGAIFSGNVVIGVVLFVIYICLAFLLGIIFAFLGTGRYIYLQVKYGKKS